MMQAAESWERSYCASHGGMVRRQPACRRILRESQMRPVFVIVAYIFGHQPLQMALVEHDHVVKQVASATPHPSFDNDSDARSADNEFYNKDPLENREFRMMRFPSSVLQTFAERQPFSVRYSVWRLRCSDRK